MRRLTNQAMLTTLKPDQILTIQNSEVVILDLKMMNNQHSITTDYPLEVIALKPQKETRDHVIRLFKLNEEQKRAFLIITEHLDDDNILYQGNSLPSSYITRISLQI